MTMFHADSGAHFISSISKLAHDRGLYLRVGDDFAEYDNLVRKQRLDQPPAPPFNPELHDLSVGESFWVVGTDSFGDLVFTQAMRHIRLTGTTLAAYMIRHFRDFPPASFPVDLDRSRYLPGPGACRITGTAYYHGDLWMRGGDAPYRGTGLPNVLARHAMITALMRTSPDFIFGFIAQKQAFKGLGEREGYMHSDPSALHWRNGKTGADIPCQMVWMGKDDLEFLLNVAPEGIMAA